MRLVASRLRRLEKAMAPAGLPRVVVRFEAPGSEKFPKPNEDEIDENTTVITVHSVRAKDGRPVQSNTQSDANV